LAEIFASTLDVIGLIKVKIGVNRLIGAINVIAAQKLIAESYLIKTHFVSQPTKPTLHLF
jgi:hypothetical protein